MLGRCNETAISLRAGCQLFLRYTTRTSALEMEDFEAAKARIIQACCVYHVVSQLMGERLLTSCCCICSAAITLRRHRCERGQPLQSWGRDSSGRGPLCLCMATHALCWRCCGELWPRYTTEATFHLDFPFDGVLSMWQQSCASAT